MTNTNNELHAKKPAQRPLWEDANADLLPYVVAYAVRHGKKATTRHFRGRVSRETLRQLERRLPALFAAARAEAAESIAADRLCHPRPDRAIGADRARFRAAIELLCERALAEGIYPLQLAGLQPPGKLNLPGTTAATLVQAPTPTPDPQPALLVSPTTPTRPTPEGEAGSSKG